MKEYKPTENGATGTTNEPGFSYGSHRAVKQPFSEFSDQMMNVLLRQAPQIKLMIIKKLSESLLESEMPSAQASADTDKESVEEKRKYYQKKYKLSDGLANLLGAVPASSIDDNWKEAKEKYLREKYESL